MIEQAKGGTKSETKQEYGRLMAELCRIWQGSRFGSYDDERRVNEPYFMAWNAHEPRMNFAAAARCWGVVELENRLRLREGVANKLVGLVINLFDELLRSLVPMEPLQPDAGTNAQMRAQRRPHGTVH